jgi:hypothetical protein
MFDKDKKYKDVPLDSEVFTKLSKYDSNDATNLGMLLANLSFPYLCCCWENENHFNKLLSKYKVDISSYEKRDKNKEHNKSEIADTRNKFPNTNANSYISKRDVKFTTQYN